MSASVNGCTRRPGATLGVSPRPTSADVRGRTRGPAHQRLVMSGVYGDLSISPIATLLSRGELVNPLILGTGRRPRHPRQSFRQPTPSASSPPLPSAPFPATAGSFLARTSTERRRTRPNMIRHIRSWLSRRRPDRTHDAAGWRPAAERYRSDERVDRIGRVCRNATRLPLVSRRRQTFQHSITATTCDFTAVPTADGRRGNRTAPFPTVPIEDETGEATQPSTAVETSLRTSCRSS